jgi:hypothetical protein
MNRSVIYLIEQPLDERNYDRFGIQTWIDRGWRVEVWDLTPLSHPRVWREHRGQQPTVPSRIFASYFPLTSEQELRRRKNSGGRFGYYVDFCGDSRQSARVRAALAQRGLRRLICSTGTIPRPTAASQGAWQARLRKVRAGGLANSLRVASRLLASKLGRFGKQGEYVTIVSGESSMTAVERTGHRQVIRAHNLDYDIFLQMRLTEMSPVERSGDDYLVFVDQDYCFHVEYVYQRVAQRLEPRRYFPILSAGLRQIGAALGTGVRVAAHPRATYDRRPQTEHFGSIPIEFGRTAELIMNSRAVICHDSTAVQFAVLFRKPVIFVTTDELNALFLDNSFKRDSIEAFASELGKSVINLSGDLGHVDWTRELTVDETKYAAYRHRYIKMDGSPQLPYWTIVIDHLERSAGPDARMPQTSARTAYG